MQYADFGKAKGRELENTKPDTHTRHTYDPLQPEGRPTPTRRNTHSNTPEGRELDYLFSVDNKQSIM